MRRYTGRNEAAGTESKRPCLTEVCWDLGGRNQNSPRATLVKSGANPAAAEVAMILRFLRADAGAGLETRHYTPDLIRVALGPIFFAPVSLQCHLNTFAYQLLV